MEKKKNALIAGATGLIGRSLVKQLLNSGFYQKIYVLARRDVGVHHPDLEIKKVDFDHLSQIREDMPVDDVFCTLGTTIKNAGSKEKFYHIDHDLALKFAQFGLNNGAQKFILVTAMGADANSLFYYNRVKGIVERSIEQLGYESVVICRPGLLLGERQESRPMEKFAQGLFKSIAPLMIKGLAKYKPIQAGKVANSMVKIAREDIKGIKILESREMQ